jgi:hypothetical protein
MTAVSMVLSRHNGVPLPNEVGGASLDTFGTVMEGFRDPHDCKCVRNYGSGTKALSETIRPELGEGQVAQIVKRR